jgi:hypothetical protein
MSLVPVPSDQQPPESNCANCNAELVADQRYCLSCGKPVSPVRLAFLDALGPGAPQPAPAGALPAAWTPGGYELTPSGYVPIQEKGAAGWARRNSGLIGLAAVLVLCLLTGLLVGHWVSQSKTPANQTIKVEGLGALGAAAAGGGGGTGATKEASSTSGGASSTAASKSPAAENKKDEEIGKHETAKEKAPPAAPKAVSKAKINKITQSTGKKHQEEINALGAEPIETG